MSRIPTGGGRTPVALDAIPGVSELRQRLGNVRAWLVGGAVRDLLRGEPTADIDVAVEGDVAAAAAALGEAATLHDRFGTATVWLGETRVDLAATRTETYERPGALPVVAPASIEEDLARRDFTINAMAVPLFSEPVLIDLHDGEADLRHGAIRVLHERSFADDPTRALRAALYAARLGFELDPETERLVREADVGTVSADRVRADIERIVREPAAPEALDLLAGWGVGGISAEAGNRVREVRAIQADEAWLAVAAPLVVAAAVATSAAAWREGEALANEAPQSASAIARLARAIEPVQLVVARAAGANWLDGWVHGLSDVQLEIGGDDLIAAGVEPGPAIGRGLAAALDAKLDGETTDRESELRLALRAAT